MQLAVPLGTLKRIRVLSPVGLPLLFCFLLCLSPGTARATSTRMQRPFSVSAALNLILPSVGVEVARQLGDRVTVAAQLTQLLTLHVDMSLRLRAFLWADDESGVYLGLNGQGWYSPLIIKGLAPAASAELGYEWRTSTGLTMGLGIGGGVLYVNEGEGTKNELEPLPVVNIRLGKSW